VPKSVPHCPTSLQLPHALDTVPHLETLTHLVRKATLLAQRLPTLQGKRLDHALRLNQELLEALWALWPVHATPDPLEAPHAD
jgi:hypothetical protein